MGRMKDPEHLRLLVNSFAESCTSDYLCKKVRQAFEKTNSLLPGSMAPDLNCRDSSGNKLSLEKYKNKFLVIDVWASWCSPCIDAFPHWKEMINALNSDLINFVGISVDQNIVDFEATIKKHQLTNPQYIADNGWNSLIMSNYKIKKIPRTIIIDPNGKIFNYNAPGPSDKLMDILTGQLKKLKN